MSESGKVLTEGLLAGYAGEGTKRGEVMRGPFHLETSHYEKDGTVYRDEWAADRSGGGQELVQTKDGKKTTRVYAGGTVNKEVLDELGIVKKDVTKYLKLKIQELGEKTRLGEDCEPDPDGDWRYSYKIVSSNTRIPLTVGIEIIEFKERPVFIHSHSIAPVE